jgi:protoporphyrinogen IX oxidase
MGGLLQSPLLWTRTLHVLAAIWLTVGVFASAVVFALLKRASDPAARAFGARTAWRLLTVYTLPGALLSGALGLYQVMAGGFGFSRGWIHASLTLWLILLAIVLFVQMPKVREAARTGSNVPPLVAILTHVNALLIVLMIFLMAFKPF